MVPFHEATRRRIPEYGDFHDQRCEIPKSQSVSVRYMYGKYFSVWFVKPKEVLQKVRTKECMEVCFYDGVQRMWMSSWAFS